jgi:hypothetical protein
MAHYPLNHHLRQTYRFFAGLAGLYLALAGILGLAATWGDPLTNDGHDWILGQRLNPAGAWIYAVVGGLIVVAVLLGGNVFHHAALIFGWGLCGLGTLVMAFLQTDANILHASMTNVITTMLLGVVLLIAGLYSKVGTADAARAEQDAAHASR